MNVWERLAHCNGFDWDKGNLEKNWEKHRVAFWEAEEVFFNQPFILAFDPSHSEAEERFYSLGSTDARRLLFIVFTLREDRIRVISARDMSGKERKVFRNYEKEKDSSV